MQQLTANLTPLLPAFVLVSAILLLAVIALLVFRTIATERRSLAQAWRKLQPFEQNCLWAGFLVFAFINLPFPYMEAYTSQVLLKITTGLGDATFAIGALALLKSLHNVVNRDDGSG